MKSYEELLAERDALAAQVDAITKNRDEWKVAKIRNAGTWLRDENVNGGNRHGHCKFCSDKVYPDDDYKLVDNNARTLLEQQA